MHRCCLYVYWLPVKSWFVSLMVKHLALFYHLSRLRLYKLCEKRMLWLFLLQRTLLLGLCRVVGCCGGSRAWLLFVPLSTVCTIALQLRVWMGAGAECAVGMEVCVPATEEGTEPGTPGCSGVEGLFYRRGPFHSSSAAANALTGRLSHSLYSTSI